MNNNFEFWCLMVMFAGMFVGTWIIILLEHLKTKKYINRNKK